MKKIVGSFLFILITTCSYAQSPMHIGIYTEGGWFTPDKISSGSQSLKNGFGFGAGFYVSIPMWEKLSASSGVGCRYKENQGEVTFNWPDVYGYSPYGYGGYGYSPYGYAGYGYSPYGYGGYGYYDPGDYYQYDAGQYDAGGGDWKKFPQHYLVIPLKLQYPVWRNLFVETGVEAAWLLNYKYIKENIESDWMVGFGCNKHRLRWSVNFLQGFKNQRMGDIKEIELGNIDELDQVGQVYRNRMLVLSLSYPLYSKKTE
jgi:hypothetical protein